MQFDHGYALLIGVGDHAADPRLSLPATVKDVMALVKTLQEPELCAYAPANLRVLLNEQATNSAIIASLMALKKRAEADPHATILIYYSGHGWVSPSGEFFLITQDTVLDAIADTALRASVLTNLLSGIRGERVLIVLDCCHAEGMAEAKDLPAPNDALAKGLAEGPGAVSRVVDALAQGVGRAVFSSCRANERSWVYPNQALSVFTYHLIEALQGAGSAPGDQTVTIGGLMRYVGKAVSATVERLFGKSQNPFFKFEATDFPVALIRGGKGLPSGGWDAIKPQAEAYLSQFAMPVTLSGGGAIAQGPGAVALGQGGVHIGGNNSGNINTGIQIAGDYVLGDKVLGDKIGKSVATGGGAHVGGKVDTGGGAFVGRDSASGSSVDNNGIANSNINAGGDVTIVIGGRQAMGSADSGRTIEEEIRLDVAAPGEVAVDAEFDVAVAIRQRGSPPLTVEDLGRTSSGKGLLLRREDDEVVTYRVEIKSSNFLIDPPRLVFHLRSGQDSEPKWFKLTARRPGRLSFLVMAYQVDGDIEVASTRVNLDVRIEAA